MNSSVHMVQTFYKCNVTKTSLHLYGYMYLKELSRVIFSYFDGVQNYIQVEGNLKGLKTAAWLAPLVERRTAVREVEGSSPRPDQHSGS